MTVTEIFKAANLTPYGPVPWKERVPERSKAGVYVVSRTNDATLGLAEHYELPFRDPPRDIEIDLDYERQQWLRGEPIVYIGQTTGQTIQQRVQKFYNHKLEIGPPPKLEVGRGGHHGGQIIHLLTCPLWVYWSPSNQPKHAEEMMINAFNKQTGRYPFGNKEGKRRPRLRRRLT